MFRKLLYWPLFDFLQELIGKGAVDEPLSTGIKIYIYTVRSTLVPY